LVLNKADLLDETERGKRVAHIIKSLRWKKPYFVISAMQGEGCKALTFAIMDFIESQKVLD